MERLVMLIQSYSVLDHLPTTSASSMMGIWRVRRKLINREKWNEKEMEREYRIQNSILSRTPLVNNFSPNPSTNQSNALFSFFLLHYQYPFHILPLLLLFLLPSFFLLLLFTSTSNSTYWLGFLLSSSSSLSFSSSFSSASCGFQ